jgi:hypothetical protein
MKSILQISTIAIVLMAFAFTSSAIAQSKPQPNKANVTQNGPKFIDEDGDGICDNAGKATERQYRHGGPGKGEGRGDCTGDQQRKQLRDGSGCDNPTAAPAESRARRGANSRK